MRVLITGMGGELGTRVAQLVEESPGVERVVGLDIDPPRRRLRRAEFHRIHPRDQDRTQALVHELAPQVVLHLGVYEPNARCSPRTAGELTFRSAETVLPAAARAGHLEQVVVRSGIEVYGRHHATSEPDETADLRPSTPFGRTLLHVEQVAHAAGSQSMATVTCLRFAPIVGPHFPSPLGRLLRLPVVPVSLVAAKPFTVVHQDDAARAVLAAMGEQHEGAINIAAPGTVTPIGAVRAGGRIPFPVVGPWWWSAKALAELVGSPVPEHVHELLVRGRTADASLAAKVLGLRPQHPAHEVMEHLHDWAPLTYLQASHTRPDLRVVTSADPDVSTA
jgi:UDP-glucose 4-epimerase